MPTYDVEGYESPEAAQPYRMEIWIEKTTMNDVLEPLCERYHVTLVCGTGFATITSTVEMLQRIKENGVPCRILYISDFDPSGETMPTSVARQAEFWISRNRGGPEIKLNQIALTREQVQQYELPKIPIKEKEKRKDGFEKRNGAGAVELDALEAVHPGVLAQIVEEQIRQFRDPKLPKKMREAERQAATMLQEQWNERIHPFQDDIDRITYDVQSVVSRYEAQLQRLHDDMEAELAPYAQELSAVWQDISAEADQITDLDLPPLPEPDVSPNDAEWLFDSGRDYFTQLAYYKKRQS